MSQLADILWRNAGQVLTPELVAGILQGAAFVPPAYIDVAQFETVSCGSYTFAVERFAPAIEELRPLHVAHYSETEKHRHGLPLQFDYTGTAEQDYLGRYLLFTVRRNGELVGHCGQRISRSAHTQTLFADEDALFLRADCRGGRTSIRFIEYMESCLTKIGVRELRVSAKLVNSADKLLIKCGFVPVATQLVKIIEVPHETQTEV